LHNLYIQVKSESLIHVLLCAAVRQLKEIRERMKKNRMKKRHGSKSKKRKSLDDEDDDDNGSEKTSSKKSKKNQNVKPSSDGKDSSKASREGSSSSEKNRNAAKKKHRESTEESDEAGANDIEDVEPDSATECKKKQKVTENGCTVNSKKQSEKMDNFDTASNSPSVDQITTNNSEDENDCTENSEKGKLGKANTKGQGKKTSNNSECDADNLERELKNLAKLPKLKVKASSEKVTDDEVEEDNKEESEEVDKNNDSHTAEAASSKPKVAKTGL